MPPTLLDAAEKADAAVAVGYQRLSGREAKPLAARHQSGAVGSSHREVAVRVIVHL